jgi:transposase InsO family protein
MWHIDTTVIRLLDGTRAYLHAVIDNFSRRILGWRVAAARRTRVEANRSASCEICPSAVRGRVTMEC